MMGEQKRQPKSKWASMVILLSQCMDFVAQELAEQFGEANIPLYKHFPTPREFVSRIDELIRQWQETIEQQAELEGITLEAILQSAERRRQFLQDFAVILSKIISTMSPTMFVEVAQIIRRDVEDFVEQIPSIPQAGVYFLGKVLSSALIFIEAFNLLATFLRVFELLEQEKDDMRVKEKGKVRIMSMSVSSSFDKVCRLVLEPILLLQHRLSTGHFLDIMFQFLQEIKGTEEIEKEPILWQ